MESTKVICSREEISGRIDPDIMELKQKFKGEYWHFLYKKVKGLNLGTIHPLATCKGDQI